MQEELIQLHRKTGLTTIFVTHDQEEALSLSDRVILLNGGKIEQVGSPSELYSKPSTRFAASFMGSTNLLDAEIVPHGDATAAHLAGGQILQLADGPASCGPATVMFRQEDIQMRPSSGTSQLTGVVVTRIFLGARVRYVIDLDGQAIRCLASTDKLFEVGETVGISVPVDRMRVLRD